MSNITVREATEIFLERLSERGLSCNKVLIPYETKIETKPITLSLYSDSSKAFANFTGRFKLAVKSYGLRSNMPRLNRITSLFENMQQGGAYFIQYDNDEVNKLFYNDVLNNIVFEYPMTVEEDPDVDITRVITLLFHKISSFLGEYGELVLFEYYDYDMDTTISLNCEVHNEYETFFLDVNTWIAPIIRLSMVNHHIPPEPWWESETSITRNYTAFSTHDSEDDNTPPRIIIVLELEDLAKDEYNTYPLFVEHERLEHEIKMMYYEYEAKIGETSNEDEVEDYYRMLEVIEEFAFGIGIDVFDEDDYLGEDDIGHIDTSVEPSQGTKKSDKPNNDGIIIGGKKK